ncbi:Protein MAIN-LIKE 1 [Glycine soja]
MNWYIYYYTNSIKYLYIITLIVQCHRVYVRLSWLQDIYRSKCDVRQWTVAARAYLLHLISCSLFANKSATCVHVIFLDAFRDLTHTGSYAWVVATLIHMYENLNDASKSSARQLVKYITLLHFILRIVMIFFCWIYEHFHYVASSIAAKDYHERKPFACYWKSRKALSTYMMGSIYYHIPTRESCTTVWTIPPHPVAPSLCIEDIDDRWIQFSKYLASVGQICVALGQCAADYMNPSLPRDPPRHPHVVHNDTFVELDLPQQSMAAAAMDEAPVDVEQPRHAVRSNASSFRTRVSSQVVLFCGCGRRVVRRVAGTNINRGRAFFTCSINKDEVGYCGYFIWVDQLIEALGVDDSLGTFSMEQRRQFGREEDKTMWKAQVNSKLDLATPVAEDVEHVDHAADKVHDQHQEAVADDVVADAQERPELKLSSHGRKVEKFGRSAPKIEGIVATTGLSLLIACSLDGDRGLISAFLERWHKETSSFHLPVGEVTITLDDVALLLYLPIIGAFHSFEALHVDQVMDLLVDLVEVSSQEARDETFQFHGAYLRDIYHSKCDVGQWIVAARAYLLHLVGYTLFANKSVTHAHVVFSDAFRDLSQTGSYAWGVAALCWIYEHFPTVDSSIVVEDYHERKPHAYRCKSEKALPMSTYCKRLDRLTSDVCAADYMEWFYMISHPFMSLTQLGNPLRHPHMSVIAPAMPEPTIAAPADVDMPRHALYVNIKCLT